MNWKDRIVSNPQILVGKPTVKGTRLSVEFLMGLFAGGWSREQVLENYPHLKPDDLNAVFAFAEEMIREEEYAAVAKIDS